MQSVHRSFHSTKTAVKLLSAVTRLFYRCRSNSTICSVWSKLCWSCYLTLNSMKMLLYWWIWSKLVLILSFRSLPNFSLCWLAGCRTTSVTYNVSQGSVFGPVTFVTYTEDVINVTRLKASSQSRDILSDHRDMTSRVADVEIWRQWCTSRRLQLNADKMKRWRSFWFGSRSIYSKSRTPISRCPPNLAGLL